MTWVRLDDAFTEHPKFLHAGPLASYLAICGIAWSNRNLTDGFVPLAQVRRLVVWDEGVDPVELADRLVEVGLWEHVDGGYRIHDYHDFQPSARQVRRERSDLSSKRAASGRQGGKQASSKRAANVQANGQHSDQQTSSPNPIPITTPPIAPQGEKPTFARKPIPKTTLERARVILASFNLQAGTDFEEVTGRGRLTDAMSRIVGALTDYPNLSVEEADRMIRWQLDHPFWDGKPHPGVVFGPKVIEKARAAADERRDTPADFVARLNARTQPGGDAA